MRTFLALVIVAILGMVAVSGSSHEAFADNGIKGKSSSQEYIYDFAVSGGAIGNIDLSALKGGHALPSGALVKSVLCRMLTAFTSSGSATVSIGDAASTARAKALTAFDNSAYNADALISYSTPYLVSSANAGKFGISIAVAALTAGKMSCVVDYYYPRNQ